MSRRIKGERARSAGVLITLVGVLHYPLAPNPHPKSGILTTLSGGQILSSSRAKKSNHRLNRQ